MRYGGYRPRKYSQYFPYKIHMEHGRPVIYNKADNPVTFRDAIDGMAKSYNTMATHYRRAYHLALAQPTAVKSFIDGEPFNMREYALEDLDRHLEDVEEFCKMMREFLNQELEKSGVRETILKLRATGASLRELGYEEAAANYEAGADRKERELEGE